MKERERLDGVKGPASPGRSSGEEVAVDGVDPMRMRRHAMTSQVERCCISFPSCLYFSEVENRVYNAARSIEESEAKIDGQNGKRCVPRGSLVE